jgi:hypothetical protein
LDPYDVFTTVLVAVGIACVVANIWRTRREEPARVNEVYAAMLAKAWDAERSGRLDIASEVNSMLAAIHEGRRLDLVAAAVPALDLNETVRGIRLAAEADVLGPLGLYGDHRLACARALQNLSERVRRRSGKASSGTSTVQN